MHCIVETTKLLGYGGHRNCASDIIEPQTICCLRYPPYTVKGKYQVVVVISPLDLNLVVLINCNVILNMEMNNKLLY